MMLKLKFQYFGHLLRRVDSLEKTLMLGGIGGRRRRDNSQDPPGCQASSRGEAKDSALLPKFTQTHVHRVSDAIQPSHPLSSPSPLAPSPSQHQSLFQ